jgi:AbrB family looped-hinge helix DNA binding protein
MNIAKVTVSPKFQIVIPKVIREELNVKPGQTLLLRTVNGRIEILSGRPVSELRGIAKGIKWRMDDRDHTERF